MNKKIKQLFIVMICCVCLYSFNDLNICAASSCINNYNEHSDLKWAGDVFPTTTSEKAYKKFSIGVHESTLYSFVSDNDTGRAWDKKSLARIASIVQAKQGEKYLINFYYHNTYADNILGETFFYDKNNNPLDITKSGVVSYVNIKINSNLIENYNMAEGLSNKASVKRRIKKTIIHELGHAFLLRHPKEFGCNEVCIMQQKGNSNTTRESLSIQAHDIKNIINVWGQDEWVFK